MTFKINREHLPCSEEEFAVAVDAHISALAEYLDHLKGVAEDAANPDLADGEKRVAFPAPEAPHPLIHQAIARTGAGTLVPNYEIVAPPIEVRKQRLMQAVSDAEAAEIAKVTPPGKARYFQMRMQEILRADSERWNAHMQQFAGGDGDPPDFVSFVTRTRADEDSRFLDEHEARRKKEEAIRFWAAKAHHDIEDLTEETVDDWQLESFRG
jgi:hypothetical protein